jgi:hypothetical protein
MIIVREGRVYGIPGSRIWDSSLIFEKHCGTASDMGRIRRRAKDQHPCRYKPMYPVIHERGRSMKHERFAHTMSAKMLLRLIETIYAFLGHVKSSRMDYSRIAHTMSAKMLLRLRKCTNKTLVAIAARMEQAPFESRSGHSNNVFPQTMKVFLFFRLYTYWTTTLLTLHSGKLL